ncbi:GNAT family N-acetyltransferase [Xenorhabdus griffiniae]|uniref:GNAT family N-acetyltransferase n=1 Tax=Xenorhabdus griffiniae TaxID=351672 RepID=UPI0030D24B53
MRTIRQLSRQEIPEVWNIDRTELIENLYVQQRDQLILTPQCFDMQGWPEGEAEIYTPILLDSYDRGAFFLGVFAENENDKLIAVASVDPQWRGENDDLLQLSFLHISKAYRGLGLGKQLFHCCIDFAKAKGAKGLYISSIPSENAVNFYRHIGCVLIAQPDIELYQREPDDIHLVYTIDT